MNWWIVAGAVYVGIGLWATYNTLIDNEADEMYFSDPVTWSIGTAVWPLMILSRVFDAGGPHIILKRLIYGRRR